MKPSNRTAPTEVFITIRFPSPAPSDLNMKLRWALEKAVGTKLSAFTLDSPDKATPAWAYELSIKNPEALSETVAKLSDTLRREAVSPASIQSSERRGPVKIRLDKLELSWKKIPGLHFGESIKARGELSVNVPPPTNGHDAFAAALKSVTEGVAEVANSSKFSDSSWFRLVMTHPDQLQHCITVLALFLQADPALSAAALQAYSQSEWIDHPVLGAA